jgi:periplasmic protein TonB
MIHRKKRNSSKVNLVISVIFHGTLIGLVFFFAAHEGLVGKRMQALTATLVPKQKKPEPPKAKPVEPKVEPPKVAETPKPAVAPPKVETAAAPPPEAAPAVAPPAVVLPDMSFSDGAHVVQSTSDPVEIYKSVVERSLKSRWSRPDDIDDSDFTAEVELNIDSQGRVLSHRWLNGSGNTVWDDSVKAAVAKTKTIGQAPPRGFPDKFIVRFDVTTAPAENGFQLSSR